MSPIANLTALLDLTMNVVALESAGPLSTTGRPGVMARAEQKDKICERIVFSLACDRRGICPVGAHFHQSRAGSDAKAPGINVSLSPVGAAELSSVTSSARDTEQMIQLRLTAFVREPL